MPTAALLLYPEALATSVTLPAEILHAAAQMSQTSRGRGISAEIQLLGTQQDTAITLDSGLRLALDGDLADLASCDLLILPAIWRHPRRVLQQAQGWLPKIRALHEQGASVCSVGTASTLLAETGLLDGRPATTHWHDFDRFEQTYPPVHLKRRHLITQSDRLYCVGSVNSIGDFMVHFVEQWYGERIARTVEAQFSPEARQSYETAAFLQESTGAHHDAVIRDTQDHMQLHPADTHSINSLAALSGLSARSFGRRFRKATGETPMRYLLNLRIREAKALLQHSDLALADIAWRCGFQSPSRFSQAFRSATALSPRAFREAVRGKRFVATNNLLPEVTGADQA
ncbi:GlxA family transcriptional regulator [Congregibacter sp.]|uniref:GlxA family transcriptional regulator n=1 Tax=Congregibacter sp. TaxID=2744308 RepID=UPI003F6B0F01